jgi:hypothetical protein
VICAQGKNKAKEGNCGVCGGVCVPQLRQVSIEGLKQRAEVSERGSHDDFLGEESSRQK